MSPGRIDERVAAPETTRPEQAAERADRVRTEPAGHARRSMRAGWSWSVPVPVWLAASRIAVGVLFAHAALVLLPQSRQHLPGAIVNSGTWWGAFDRWDSKYYLQIAAHGYPVDQPALTAFLPGYPATVAALHGLTGGLLGYLQSATLVSWAAFAGATVLLYRLVLKRFGARAALVAAALFCWFPASAFFMSPYSESFFAFEILAVATLLESRRFLIAAAVAGLASGTSPESVALTLGIVVAAVAARQKLGWIVAYVLVSGWGLAGYMAFLWNRFGRPLEFVQVEKAWHRSQNLPFVGLFRNFDALRHFFVGAGPPPGSTAPTYENVRLVWILDDASLAVAALLLVYLLWIGLRRYRTRPLASTPAPATSAATATGTGPRSMVPSSIPAAWLAICGVIVLIASCTTIYPYGSSTYSSTEGEARFVSVAFPLFVGAALLLRRRLGPTVAVVSASVAAALLFQVMYNLGYWLT